MIDVTKFGTEEMPVRPSSLTKLLKCPMSMLLTYFGDSEQKTGLHTGSTVHAAVEAFHRSDGSIVEAQAAMETALATFPEANRDKARAWTEGYINDPTNQSAAVTAIELKVQLRYRGVYIAGTLDQIRREEDGRLIVWDLKTGTSLLPDDCVAEYQTQQAAYVLAARQTLSLPVLPGGLIFAAGYDKRFGRRFLPMGVRVEDCEQLMDEVVREVEAIRAGGRHYRPTADHCRFCPLKPFPSCKERGRLLL